ncbi:hypothetical protein WJX74_000737 [Apatococcus lobatus]|uniref:Uncharacterized protein n=1 Tax=Apatococcus lobatus TaxID=904363 RepID=A0AAW1RUU5_9CHLO
MTRPEYSDEEDDVSIRHKLDEAGNAAHGFVEEHSQNLVSMVLLGGGAALLALLASKRLGGKRRSRSNKSTREATGTGSESADKDEEVRKADLRQRRLAKQRTGILSGSDKSNKDGSTQESMPASAKQAGASTQVPAPAAAAGQPQNMDRSADSAHNRIDQPDQPEHLESQAAPAESHQVSSESTDAAEPKPSADRSSAAHHVDRKDGHVRDALQEASPAASESQMSGSTSAQQSGTHGSAEAPASSHLQRQPQSAERDADSKAADALATPVTRSTHISKQQSQPAQTASSAAEPPPEESMEAGSASDEESQQPRQNSQPDAETAAVLEEPAADTDIAESADGTKDAAQASQAAPGTFATQHSEDVDGQAGAQIVKDSGSSQLPDSSADSNREHGGVSKATGSQPEPDQPELDQPAEAREAPSSGAQQAAATSEKAHADGSAAPGSSPSGLGGYASSGATLINDDILKAGTMADPHGPGKTTVKAPIVGSLDKSTSHLGGTPKDEGNHHAAGAAGTSESSKPAEASSVSEPAQANEPSSIEPEQVEPEQKEKRKPTSAEERPAQDQQASSQAAEDSQKQVAAQHRPEAPAPATSAFASASLHRADSKTSEGSGASSGRSYPTPGGSRDRLYAMADKADQGKMSQEDMRAAMSNELRGLVMGSAPSLETFGTDINCLYDSDDDKESRSTSRSPPPKPPRGRTPEPPQRPKSPVAQPHEEVPQRAKSPSFEEWRNSILRTANLERLAETGTESQKEAAKSELADAAAHGLHAAPPGSSSTGPAPGKTEQQATDAAEESGDGSAKLDSGSSEQQDDGAEHAAAQGPANSVPASVKQEQQRRTAGESPDETSTEADSGVAQQHSDDAAGQASSAQDAAHSDPASNDAEQQGRTAAEETGHGSASINSQELELQHDGAGPATAQDSASAVSAFAEPERHHDSATTWASPTGSGGYASSGATFINDDVVKGGSMPDPHGPGKTSVDAPIIGGLPGSTTHQPREEEGKHEGEGTTGTSSKGSGGHASSGASLINEDVLKGGSMADPHGPGKKTVEAPIVGGLPGSSAHQSEEEGGKNSIESATSAGSRGSGGYANNGASLINDNVLKGGSMADPHGPGKTTVNAPIVGGLPESSTRQPDEEGGKQEADSATGAGSQGSGGFTGSGASLINDDVLSGGSMADPHGPGKTAVNAPIIGALPESSTRQPQDKKDNDQPDSAVDICSRGSRGYASSGASLINDDVLGGGSMADPHGPGKTTVKAPIVGGLPESSTRQPEEEGVEHSAERATGAGSSGSGGHASSAASLINDDVLKGGTMADPHGPGKTMVNAPIVGGLSGAKGPASAHADPQASAQRQRSESAFSSQARQGHAVGEQLQKTASEEKPPRPEQDAANIAKSDKEGTQTTGSAATASGKQAPASSGQGSLHQDKSERREQHDQSASSGPSAAATSWKSDVDKEHQASTAGVKQSMDRKSSVSQSQYIWSDELDAFIRKETAIEKKPELEAPIMEGQKPMALPAATSGAGHEAADGSAEHDKLSEHESAGVGRETVARPTEEPRGDAPLEGSSSADSSFTFSKQPGHRDAVDTEDQREGSKDISSLQKLQLGEHLGETSMPEYERLHAAKRDSRSRGNEVSSGQQQASASESDEAGKPAKSMASELMAKADQASSDDVQQGSSSVKDEVSSRQAGKFESSISGKGSSNEPGTHESGDAGGAAKSAASELISKAGMSPPRMRSEGPSEGAQGFESQAQAHEASRKASSGSGNGFSESKQVYKVQPEQSGRQARRQSSHKQPDPPAKPAGTSGHKPSQPTQATSSPHKPSAAGAPRSWADAAAGRTPSQQPSAAAHPETAGPGNGEGASSSQQLNGSSHHASSSRKRRSKSGNNNNKSQAPQEQRTDSPPRGERLMTKPASTLSPSAAVFVPFKPS